MHEKTNTLLAYSLLQACEGCQEPIATLHGADKIV